jgi:hypothetical protein
MAKTFIEEFAIQRVAPDGTAATTFNLSAGTTDVNSSAVDLLNGSGVAFTIYLGTLTSSATLGVKLQTSADGSTGWTDVAGTAYTSTADTDDHKLIVLNLEKPLESQRFVRVAFDRGGANAVIDALTATMRRRVTSNVQHATVEAAIAVSN